MRSQPGKAVAGENLTAKEIAQRIRRLISPEEITTLDRAGEVVEEFLAEQKRRSKPDPERLSGGNK